ncbi:MAG TPA: endonuclease/exonuclease/phosphatase family protein [Spirochaetia bacterium]|nr:endonuclease/exonuclease/phosphatase family protein [Spirochaetia bacterium]
MNLRVMTFNLRLNTSRDGEYAWPNRTSAVRAVIAEHAPDVLCTQEGLPEMVDWMSGQFPDYHRLGTGRMADGSDEHVAIFASEKRFEVETHGQFWISPQPDEPGSKAWGTFFPRICTWCVVSDIETKTRLAVFNAHLDNRQLQARLAASEIIGVRMMEIARRSGDRLPFVLCGDFNAHPDSEEVASFCDASDDGTRVLLAGCSDNTQGTYHEFRGVADEAPIDYVLTTPDVRVLRRFVDDRSYHGTWPSDHFPVIADLEVPSATTTGRG